MKWIKLIIKQLRCKHSYEVLETTNIFIQNIGRFGYSHYSNHDMIVSRCDKCGSQQTIYEPERQYAD